MKTFISTLLCFIFTSLIYAQVETKLTSPDGRNGDLFGYAVALGEDYCIVGEPGNTVWPNLEGGTTHSFKRNPETGIWEHISFIDGDFHGARCGGSLSTDNNNIIVGKGIGIWSGQGYCKMFTLDENGYFQNSSIVSDTVKSFGYSVAIKDELAISGSFFDNENGVNSGAAFIFKKEENIWEKVIKIMASDGNEFDNFGTSVAISEEYAVIGASMLNKVYVYNITGNLRETIISSEITKQNNFGNSVSISRDYIIVGEPAKFDSSDEEIGAAYIYKMENGEWRMNQRLVPSDSLSTRGFGTSVCIKDSIIVIGANGGKNHLERQGAAYVFTRTGDIWTERFKLNANDGFAGNKYGESVGLSDANIIVGASGAYLDFSESWNFPGAAYIYEGLFSGYLKIENLSLDMENVQVGQSHSKSIRIKNEGLENLNITSISISGTGQAAYSYNSEPFFVESGETFYLPVTFSPATLRTFEASLLIESDVGNKTVSLTGKGSHTLSISKNEINFGEVRVGKDSVSYMYIRNIGENYLTVDSIYMQESMYSDSAFTIDVEFPFSVSPESSKQISVKFEPTDNADYMVNVKIESSVGDETVTLKGTGFKSGIPQVWPDTIFFGRVRLGENITKPLTIGNLAADPIKVGPITITGSEAGDFRVNKDTVTVTNNPQIIYVSYFPGAEGTSNAKLNTNTNTNAGNKEILLTGFGVAEGFLDVTPDTIQFGEERANIGSSKQLFVGNFGVVDVNVSSISISGPDASAFYVDASSLNLAPAAIKRLNIAYIPVNQGSHSANLEFVSNGGNITVPLLGNCIICNPEPKTIVTPSDGMDGVTGGFGTSVAISGNKALIGGFVNDLDEGSAYIFGCDGTTWVQQEKLQPLTDTKYMDFGRSVDISGNYAIVGAPYYVNKNTERLDGAAYIFSKQFMAGWNEVDMLKVENGYYNANLGQSVALDDKTAIVGAPGTFNFPNKNEGAAYIFHGASPAGGKGWELLNKLTAPDAKENFGFGTSVDISGKYAIVGTTAYGAYIFGSSSPTGGGSWHFIEKLISNDFHPNDFFGYQVSLSGDYALVSAPTKPASTQHGAVYAFKRIGISWIQVYKLTPPHPNYQEQFGSSISLSGDFALVASGDQGTVYLFQRIKDNQWDLIETIDEYYEGFGKVVALDAFAGYGISGTSTGFANNMYSGYATIYSAFATVQTGIEKNKMQSEASLNQNYPNPFTTSTVISFNVESRAMVSLRIFDILGKEIEVLVNEVLAEGDYDIIFNANDLPDEIYLYELQTGKSISIKKMLLIK